MDFNQPDIENDTFHKNSQVTASGNTIKYLKKSRIIYFLG
jgi:hypothetical protein